jgi:hypothetical protein
MYSVQCQCAYALYDGLETSMKGGVMVECAEHGLGLQRWDLTRCSQQKSDY